MNRNASQIIAMNQNFQQGKSFHGELSGGGRKMVIEKKVGTDLETWGSGLAVEDLRTSAKAMQNRMWKIEFTKQLSIELIYILHGREAGE